MAKTLYNWLMIRMAAGQGSEPPTPPTPVLPTGYTQVQYLELNGSGYIDLGIQGNEATDAAEVDVQLAATTAQTRIVSTHGSSRYFQFYVNGSSGLGFNHNSTWKGMNTITFDTNRHTIGIDYKNLKTWYDSTEASFSGSSSKVAGSNTTIGGKYGTNPRFTGRVYGAKFWNNGSLTINAVMCRDANNDPYVYNTVSDTFLTIAGSGTTVGPDV